MSRRHILTKQEIAIFAEIQREAQEEEAMLRAHFGDDYDQWAAEQEAYCEMTYFLCAGGKLN